MKIEDKVLEVAKFCEIDAHKFSFKADPDKYLVVLGKEEDIDWSEGLIYYKPNKDWDWLMKAWERFRDLPIKKSIGHKYKNSDFEWHLKHRTQISYSICFETIAEAFESLYEGINWYNNLNN